MISDVTLDVELPIRDCNLGESQLGDVTLDVELPIREATAKKYLFLEYVELRIGYRIPRSPPILIRRDSLYKLTHATSLGFIKML